MSPVANVANKTITNFQDIKEYVVTLYLNNSHPPLHTHTHTLHLAPLSIGNPDKKIISFDKQCSLYIYEMCSLYNPVADPGFSKWGGRCFVTNGGAHILFSGKKCMKLKEIGLKWGGARLLAPCYSKITIFL